MRGAIFFGVGAIASVAAMGYYAEHAAWVKEQVAKKPAPSVPTVKECRDLCEQRVIVEALGDEALRACRLRCEGADTATRPYEPIDSVTRAPADHRLEHPPARPITVAPAAHAPPR